VLSPGVWVLTVAGRMDVFRRKERKSKDYAMQHLLMYVGAHHSDVAMAAFALHQKCMQVHLYNCLHSLPAATKSHNWPHVGTDAGSNLLHDSSGKH